MLRHHTSFPLSPAPLQLSYQDSFLTLGSCFAQNLGQRLQEQLYDTCLNPFGVVYNPYSIANSLRHLLETTHFEAKDLLAHRDAWHSLQHHSSFSGTDQAAMLVHLNQQLRQARQHLQRSRCLLLTFGTAWVYEWKATGQIVSNCHHFPAQNFERRRLSVAQIVTLLREVLASARQQIGHLEVVFTVSPVRHLKDGLVENQRSKATLILAVQELVEQLDYCHYFPAYELLLDDLRDYRYYEKDLVHPSALAIDYVWEAFEQCHLKESEQPLRQQVLHLQRAVQHRARHPKSERHQHFLQQQLERLEKLAPRLPVSSVAHLKAQFLAQIL